MQNFKTPPKGSATLHTEEHITEIIEVREFSKANADTHHEESTTFVGYKWMNEDFSSGYYILVYPNMFHSSTEGQVLLEFRFHPGFYMAGVIVSKISYVELTCVVTVVDVEGCRRLPQSFAFTHEVTQGKRKDPYYFFIQNIISRDSLLSLEELLPEDTLTMQLDMVLNVYRKEVFYRDVDFDELVSDSIKTEWDGNEIQRYLSLDSPVAELLRKESWYFERLSATPMVEKNSGYVEILGEEYNNFRLMVKVLGKLASYDNILAYSFEGIPEIYAMADFYGIESVLDTCRRWLRLVCHTKDRVSAISRLAEWFDDKILKEIADRASWLNKDEIQIQGNDFGKSYPGESDEKWAYTPIRGDVENLVPPILVFEWLPKDEEEEDRCEDLLENVSDISNCYI